MYRNNEISLTNWEIDSLYKRKKFRIYGNVLGTMDEVISLLSALEVNYNFILACEKFKVESILNYPENVNDKDKYLKDIGFKLRSLYEKRFSEIILAEECIVINKINWC